MSDVVNRFILRTKTNPFTREWRWSIAGTDHWGYWSDGVDIQELREAVKDDTAVFEWIHNNSLQASYLGHEDLRWDAAAEKWVNPLP
ncbi:MAG: hypothetical protein A3H70_04975 [Candidatus Komeilibacteria bacterium RIFCSPLOWO2_02_FULL_48_11]|uniref:Uncharacterized protein n=1 Tax=Candidatus Komeilibacteria bacterium RIFCSPLOWO2_02_FULL_48_11 TaxID=1798553 RepID=A0A1G2BUA3_9BACT|nr:MAG: hypothetical protein A3H70_04975 [Candidatus Komeilibacteria bacterium RIFCSPLOWO2_02_FULL_48_11]